MCVQLHEATGSVSDGWRGTGLTPTQQGELKPKSVKVVGDRTSPVFKFLCFLSLSLQS